MSDLPYFDRESAPAELRDIYDLMVQDYGPQLPTVYKVMFHSPPATQAIRDFHAKVFPSWKLDRKLYALAYLKTTQLHDCTY